jgi:hypothetical protein
MAPAVPLVDSLCPGPVAGCKHELAIGVEVLLWMIAASVGLAAAWKTASVLFGPGDTPDSQASEITRAGRWFKFYRRVLPMFLALLLVALILATARSRLAAWAG